MRHAAIPLAAILVAILAACAGRAAEQQGAVRPGIPGVRVEDPPRCEQQLYIEIENPTPATLRIQAIRPDGNAIDLDQLRPRETRSFPVARGVRIVTIRAVQDNERIVLRPSPRAEPLDGQQVDVTTSWVCAPAGWRGR